jgi:hypothetical protein
VSCVIAVLSDMILINVSIAQPPCPVSTPYTPLHPL